MVTTITFGQDLSIEQSIIESPPYGVGDIITVRFTTNDILQSEPTLIQFDYQYNVKLLEKLDHTFKLDNNSSAMTSLNHYDGYVWTPLDGINPSNLSGQYQKGSYSTNSDFAVERITVQDAIKIAHDVTILEVRFKVKDKLNSSYESYTESTELNWAYVKDNSTDIVYDVWTESREINLGGVSGGTVDDITFKVNTPVNNKSDYRYTVETIPNGDLQSFEIVAEGNLDSAGETTVSGLKDGESYRFFAYVPADYTDPQNPTYPSWLDDVVTVSDAYLVFNYMTSTDIDGNGTGTFDYFIQELFADITWDENDIPIEGQAWESGVDDDDSYVFLSHLAGVLPDFNSESGENFYPITSTKYGSFNYTMRKDEYGMMMISNESGEFTDPSAFTVSSDTSVITYSVGLNGDVDLSHSHTPEQSGYPNSSKSVSVGKVRNTSFQKVPESSNLDISTQLLDGKVVMDISTTKTGLAGAQFNLTYDTNILEFSEVIFDSGNEMTNFANEKDGKIFIGSLDLKGEQTVKTGTPYKVIFTPKQTITNTIGLVSFGVKEGVKTDGTKVKFNIQ
jgi:hypothetical protein